MCLQVQSAREMTAPESMMIHQSDASVSKCFGVIDALLVTSVAWVTQTLWSTHKSIFLKKFIFPPFL